MKTSEANLTIRKVLTVGCADLYFMDNIVIVEVKRHAIMGKDEVEPILDAIKEEYKSFINVHYISNRTEVYSLKPTELVLLKNKINSFKSYSVITYGDKGKTNLVFERMFLKKEIKTYENLHMAIEAVSEMNNSARSNYYVA